MMIERDKQIEWLLAGLFIATLLLAVFLSCTVNVNIKHEGIARDSTAVEKADSLYIQRSFLQDSIIQWRRVEEITKSCLWDQTCKFVQGKYPGNQTFFREVEWSSQSNFFDDATVKFKLIVEGRPGWEVREFKWRYDYNLKGWCSENILY